MTKPPRLLTYEGSEYGEAKRDQTADLLCPMGTTLPELIRKAFSHQDILRCQI